MNQVKETGGALIGVFRATWPFATLTVTKDVLELKVSLIGKFIFRQTDIISIEPYSYFLNRGLKINHKVPTYDDNIIFLLFEDPDNLIERIEQTGFLSTNKPVSIDIENTIATTQSQGGFPIKTHVAIAIVVIWNILFLVDFNFFFTGNKIGFPLGIGAKSALGFIFLICVALLIFKPVRKVILKEGRSIDDIKTFVLFLMYICAFMFLSISVMHH